MSYEPETVKPTFKLRLIYGKWNFLNEANEFISDPMPHSETAAFAAQLVEAGWEAER